MQQKQIIVDQSKIRKSEWHIGNLRRFRFYTPIIWNFALRRVNHLSKKYANISQLFSSALRHASRLRSRVDVEASRRVSSRRVTSRRSRIWTAQVDGYRENAPGVRGDWSRRFRTDSQGKVSWSIVPALVSFINVIPVYEMRGLSYLLGFLFSNLLSAFVSAYGTTGARIVPGIVNDYLQWKSTPKPRSL